MSARISILGPTHPYTGGISQHDTRLAHELAKRGHHVRIESWSAQYPGFLYKGTPRVDRDAPEIPPYPDTVERLAWYNPLTWWSAGRRVRDRDVAMYTVVTPFHAVPYLFVMGAAGRRGTRAAIVHNVLPHEPSAVDRLLMRTLLRRMDAVIVHSDAQAALARQLDVPAERIVVSALPFPGIVDDDDVPPLPSAADGVLRALFFGTIRHYKGLDLLLRAVAEAPGVRLLVAGDFWQPVAEYEQLIADLGIADRVELRAGYVASDDIPGLFAASDVLVMPYRSGTASIVSSMAQRYGRPVIVTDVGTLASDVDDQVNGIVVPAEDAGALGAALRQLSAPGEAARMGAASRNAAAIEVARWSAYADAVDGIAARGTTR